jgi:hypothetical protein
LNGVHELSAKIRDYKSNDKTVEVNPINEGFILLSDNLKKSSSETSSSTSAGPTTAKRTVTPRTVKNVSTTTCKTKHQTTATPTKMITTTTLQKTPNHTVNHPAGRLGRRILTDLSYDTDITETSSTQASLEDDTDVESFLKVDNEELSKQLAEMTDTTGSGDESMCR